MGDITGTIETNRGTIEVELWPDVAPNTVDNWCDLAEDGFYDGLIFHRVIEGFMIQGGCPNGDGTGGPGYTIDAEFNDRTHEPGVLSMARKGHDVDSAGSQFFIMLEHHRNLDGDYTAFGKVTDGMDVVKEIGSVDTDARDKPADEVVMESVEVQGREDS